MKSEERKETAKEIVASSCVKGSFDIVSLWLLCLRRFIFYS